MKFLFNKKFFIYLSYSLYVVIALTVIKHVYSYNVDFLPIHNIIFGIFTASISFFIAIRAHKCYKKTSNPKMPLIAASFFAGGVFEVFHFLSSKVITIQFIYWYFEAFSYLSGLLLSIYFTSNYVIKDKIKFQRNIYLIFAAFVLLVRLIIGSEEGYISAIALTLPFEVIYMALFILTAFIYSDIRINKNKSLFSPLIFGILFLTFSDIFEPNLFYYQSQYRFILHFNDILALTLIYFGFQDLLLNLEFFSIKHKFLIYNGIFICILYWVIILYSAIVAGFDFHSYFKYLFFIIFCILIISVYFLTAKITQPISKITETIIKNKPGKKPEIVPIISNDEIAILTKAFNESAVTSFEYSEKIKEAAKKEAILRKMISELKISQDIDTIYNYIIKKIAEIFSCDRVFLIKDPTSTYETIKIDYEYFINENETSALNTVIIPNITDKIKKSINAKKVIFNLNINSSKNEEYFYKKYNIKKALVVPLIRYNKDSNIIGVLVLCYKTDKELTDNETDLLTSIANSVISTIWEVLKISEIEKMRDTFIATLAHDIQVPLIGEKNVLQFLLKRNNLDNIGKYKIILSELLKSNDSLIEQLKTLIDIYYYESGKKNLQLTNVNIINVFKEITNLYEKKTKVKNIKIDLNIDTKKTDVFVDVIEIKKVFSIILDNAIKYSPENSAISINSQSQNGYISICIKDQGKGMNKEIQEKIFKRYEMAQAIDREVGKGFSLYLCKLIIESHKGDVYFKSVLNEGTTFCIKLPAY